MRNKKFSVEVTEKDLVDLLRTNNELAMRIIYQQYSRALYGIMLRIVRTDPPAADLWQDAMVKVWRQAETYDEKRGTLFTWLLNICRNTAIDYLRSSGYKRASHTVNTEEVDNTATYLQTEYIGLRERAMKVSKEHREIIDLLYFQGYSHTEAADALSIPLGTLKTKARAALTEIKHLFKEYDR